MALCVSAALAVTGPASFSQDAFSCGVGEYILFTPTEFKTASILNVKPISATGDDYQALALIFAAVLAASCVIWGVKQVLRLLRNPSEF